METGTATSFSVYLTTIFLPDNFILEKGGLTLEEAVVLSKKVTERVNIALVRIVGEEDDCTYFEWQKDKGVVFPPKELLSK